jgi:ABC-type Zn uptake system ZnuABC Zn-binding protein ZnuA
MWKPVCLALAAISFGWTICDARAEPISDVAAENFYGDVAEQLGGPNVKVTSILTNPDQDPHLFEASAATARDLAGARLVIFNGADYDPWMTKLLAASKPRSACWDNDRSAAILSRLPSASVQLGCRPCAARLGPRRRRKRC